MNVFEVTELQSLSREGVDSDVLEASAGNDPRHRRAASATGCSRAPHVLPTEEQLEAGERRDIRLSLLPLNLGSFPVCPPRPIT